MKKARGDGDRVDLLRDFNPSAVQVEKVVGARTAEEFMILTPGFSLNFTGSGNFFIRASIAPNAGAFSFDAFYL